MAARSEIGLDQQQIRLNYQESRFPDGMVRERSWETPQGNNIQETVQNRGVDTLVDKKRWRWKLLHEKELITGVQHLERKTESNETFLQTIKFVNARPTGINPGRDYQSANPYVEISGVFVEERGVRVDKPGRSYYRALYPDGEIARFQNEQGRDINVQVRYQQTENGLKKTTIRTEEEPPKYVRPGVESTAYRFKSRDVKEELLQENQLPPLPSPNTPNGFPSLDAVPAEYYKLPPF